MNEDEKWEQAARFLMQALKRAFGPPDCVSRSFAGLKKTDRLGLRFHGVAETLFAYRDNTEGYAWKWGPSQWSIRNSLATWATKQPLDTPEQALALVSVLDGLDIVAEQAEKLLEILEVLGVEVSGLKDETGITLSDFITGLPPATAFPLWPEFQVVADAWRKAK